MLFRKMLKYFISGVLCLMPYLASAQEPDPLFIKLRADLTAKDQQVNMIKLRGKTNLPQGIQLRLVLKGLCTAPSMDYDQILDIIHIPVNAQGGLVSHLVLNQSHLFYQGIRFLPDYYELKVSVEPDEIKKFALSEDEISRLKRYYYLDLWDSHHLEQRRAKSKTLKKHIDYLWLVDKELKQQINSFEEVKQGSSEIERIILRAFGIYKTKEEVIQELTRSWFGWESQWRKKVSRILGEIKASSVYCISTTDCLIQRLDELSAMASTYRLALDPQNKAQTILSSWSVKPADWAKISSDEIKQQCFELLEYELLSKGGNDVMRLIEHLTNNYLRHIDEPENIDLKSWEHILQRSLEYLKLLKAEFSQYADEGLFQSKGFIDETGYPESYEKLQEVINMIPDLEQPMSRHLADPANKTYRYEITKIVATINGKVEEFFDILH